MTDEDIHDIYFYPNDDVPDEEIMERLSAKLRASDEEYQRLISEKQEQEEAFYERIMIEYIEIEYENSQDDLFDLRAIEFAKRFYNRKSQNKIKKIREAITYNSPEEIAQLRLEDSPEFRAIHRFLIRDRSLDPKLQLQSAPERQSQQPQSTGRRMIQL